MGEIKTPEDAVRVIIDALRFLEQVKVKAERPLPIVKDRHGKPAKDYTLKDWFAKLNEELDELKAECLDLYWLTDTPGEEEPPTVKTRREIADEACDLIKAVYSMCNQMGIDGDFMEKSMHECNAKTRERGCHENC